VDTSHDDVRTSPGLAYSPELEICEPSGFRHQTIRYGRRRRHIASSIQLAAEALGEVGPLTEREHHSEAIDKLGASNRVDAARIARDKGWL
jgi:hypothetical protein